MNQDLMIVPLLLADPSPHLRMLALRDLFSRDEDDPEMQELAALCAADPLVTDLRELQDPDGAWRTVHQADAWGASAVQRTALALLRLGYLGYGPEDPTVQRGAEYLFSMQRKDGSWPLPAEGQREEGEEEVNLGGSSGRRSQYSMMPLQTAIPLRGLAACGYADDPRAERAYDWLLSKRLEDGAWPTGIAAGDFGFVAGYRRIPHSRWGCRSNTTGALLCLALHPTRRNSPAARRALDLLLGRETREEFSLGFYMARLVGAEPAHGFTTFYARFDLAILLDLCWRIGASLEDDRVRDLVSFIRGLQGEYGMWTYRRRPQISRWLTFDLLRSLTALAEGGEDWQSMEPRTPFQPYPRKPKRY